MTRRDRLERAGRRGQRAARRSHAPTFFGSDDGMDNEDIEDDLGMALMKKRTRKQHDERPDLDDLDGVEDVGCRVFHASLLTSSLIGIAFGTTK